MKRDLDLVRQILQSIEAESDNFSTRQIFISGREEDEVGFHVLLLIEAGLLNGQDVLSGNGVPIGLAERITWSGYEFLDAARNESVWARAKSAAGGMGMNALKSALAALAAAEAVKLIK